jgi:hypothetical protein
MQREDAIKLLPKPKKKKHKPAADDVMPTEEECDADAQEVLYDQAC